MPSRYPEKKGSRLFARFFLISLVLAACQPIQPDSQLSAPPVLAPTQTQVLPAETDAIQTTNAADEKSEGLPVAPTGLTIPTIALDVPVQPMGWEIISTGGARTTRWTVPDDSAGWHVDSAVPGQAGVALISGSQFAGEAVFAPLALGEVEAGQEVDVTLSDGSTVRFVVTEVSPPIALHGASAAEEAAIAGYLRAGETPRLVLITGWPDFTTTHRVFVVAQAAEAGGE